jgi:ATP-dependent exoDNAse (exonuclease V) alpha subunit
LDPIRDVQILCPMNRGSLGDQELNQRLQRVLNPPKLDEPVVEKYGWRFQIQDKVIQTENNYEKEVFNGDIGPLNPSTRSSTRFPSALTIGRSITISANWTKYPWHTR